MTSDEFNFDDLPDKTPALTKAERAQMSVEMRFELTKNAFFHNAKRALGHRFENDAALDSFYEAIPTNTEKLQFTEACTQYWLLVRDGDWYNNINGELLSYSYVTNSFKLVALFAIIESLSPLKHQDFYQWLRTKPNALPIVDSKILQELYADYKQSFGSIRKVIAFFELLSTDHQARLCKLLNRHSTPMESIKVLAQHLYAMRSNFAHEAKVAVALDNNNVIQYVNSKAVNIKITMPDILEAFELGLISRFRQHPT